MKKTNYAVEFLCVGWQHPFWGAYSESLSPVWKGNAPFKNGRIDAVRLQDGTVIDKIGSSIPGWNYVIGKAYGGDPYNWEK